MPNGGRFVLERDCLNCVDALESTDVPAPTLLWRRLTRRLWSISRSIERPSSELRSARSGNYALLTICLRSSATEIVRAVLTLDHIRETASKEDRLEIAREAAKRSMDYILLFEVRSQSERVLSGPVADS